MKHRFNASIVVEYDNIWIETTKGMNALKLNSDNIFYIDYEVADPPEELVLGFSILLNETDFIKDIYDQIIVFLPPSTTPYRLTATNMSFSISGTLYTTESIQSKYKLLIRQMSTESTAYYYIHDIIAVSQSTKNKVAFLYEDFETWFNNDLNRMPTGRAKLIIKRKKFKIRKYISRCKNPKK